MRYLVLLSLFLYSCGEDPCKGTPDFYTSQGICVFLNNMHIEELRVNQTIDVLEREMIQRNGYTLSKIRKDYDKTSISFQELLPKDDANGFTTFHWAKNWKSEKYLTYASIHVKVYEDVSCFNYLTLLHEVLHVQAYSTEKIMGGHPKIFFGSEAGTFEYDTEIKLICEMCGYC